MKHCALTTCDRGKEEYKRCKCPCGTCELSRILLDETDVSQATGVMKNLMPVSEALRQADAIVENAPRAGLYRTLRPEEEAVIVLARTVRAGKMLG